MMRCNPAQQGKLMAYVPGVSAGLAIFLFSDR